MRYAVIGSGISGLSAAWLLSRQAEVHLFEIDNRLGGHAHTVFVDSDVGEVPVDTGFIVYNARNYPNLCGFFDCLGVEGIDTGMSFGFSQSLGEHRGQFEYASSFGGLVAQPHNLINPRWWRMMADIIRFCLTAVNTVKDNETLGDFITRKGYGASFVERFLLPMSSAIWSCPKDKMLGFPARSFIAFFDNHELLKFYKTPVWRTVKGGSRQYVNAVAADLGGFIHTDAKIISINRHVGKTTLTIAGEGVQDFDAAILATPADVSLRLIGDATADERRILGAFDFHPNRAVLHSDIRLMPKRPQAWAAWNYLAQNDPTQNNIEPQLCVSYWMNRLQNIDCAMPLIVTLNPFLDPKPELVHGEYQYRHPVIDRKAVQAQKALPQIQGVNGLFFCGAWTGYGFHEDGIKSAVAVAQRLGVALPWQDNSGDPPTTASIITARRQSRVVVRQPLVAGTPVTGRLGAGTLVSETLLSNDGIE